MPTHPCGRRTGKLPSPQPSPRPRTDSHTTVVSITSPQRCWSGFSRETTNRTCGNRERDIVLGSGAGDHGGWEVLRSVCNLRPSVLRTRAADGLSPRSSREACEPGLLMLEGRRWMALNKQRASPPLPHLCILFRSSVAWMVPTCTGEGNLLYSVHQCKCSSLLETPRTMCHQLSGIPSPGKWTHALSHPRVCLHLLGGYQCSKFAHWSK